MCNCSGGTRTTKVFQREIPESQRQIQAISHKRSDAGNPVNIPSNTNVVRSNQVNRERYHTQHFGGK